MESSPKVRPDGVDYFLAGIAPALIIGMIGSLVYFLIIVTYLGPFAQRLMWILGCYTFGAVFIARIAIEQSRALSFGYMVALGAAVLAVASRYFVVSGPMAIFSFPILVTLLVIVAVLADRITFDCTSMNEQVESSGVGLLQSLGLATSERQKVESKQKATETSGGTITRTTSKRRRKHNPGVWVLYLALLALPLFGLGQLLIQGEQDRRMAFLCLFVYLLCSLCLLVLIALLTLRKYLRERGVPMETGFAIRWLAIGIVSVISVLGVLSLLPIPGRSILTWEMPFKITSRDDLQASRFGWGPEGAKGKGKEVPPQNGQDPQAGDRQGGQQQNGQQQNGQQQNGQQQNGQQQNGQQQNGQQQNGQQQSGQQQNGQQQSGQQQSGQQQSGQQQSGQQQSGQQQSGQQQGGQQQSGDKQQGEKQGGQPRGSDKQNGETPDSEQQNDAKKNRERQPDGNQDRAENRNNPEPGKFKESQTKETTQQPEQPRSSPTTQSIQWNVSAGIQWLTMLMLAIAFIVFAVIYRRQLMEALRGFRDWWFLLWGGKRNASPNAQSSEPSESAIKEPFPAFVSFTNPFQSNTGWSREQIVRYIYRAVLSWGYEHRIVQREDETPEEYIRRLARRYSERHDDLQHLGKLYNRIAYARGSVSQEELKPVADLWKWLSLNVA